MPFTLTADCWRPLPARNSQTPFGMLICHYADEPTDQSRTNDPEVARCYGLRHCASPAMVGFSVSIPAIGPCCSAASCWLGWWLCSSDHPTFGISTQHPRMLRDSASDSASASECLTISSIARESSSGRLSRGLSLLALNDQVASRPMSMLGVPFAANQARIIHRPDRCRRTRSRRRIPGLLPTKIAWQPGILQDVVREMARSALTEQPARSITAIGRRVVVVRAFVRNTEDATRQSRQIVQWRAHGESNPGFRRERAAS
jgi:hypothetical protein